MLTAGRTKPAKAARRSHQPRVLGLSQPAEGDEEACKRNNSGGKASGRAKEDNRGVKKRASRGGGLWRFAYGGFLWSDHTIRVEIGSAHRGTLPMQQSGAQEAEGSRVHTATSKHKGHTGADVPLRHQ